MTEQIHDREADTSEPVVRALLASQRPEWSELPLSRLRTSGTSNAMWRIEASDLGDLVVRLPLIESADEGMTKEHELLPRLARTPLAEVVELPTLHHGGTPSDDFPYRWSVLGWIAGDDAWSARDDLGPTSAGLAADLAGAVHEIGRLQDLPAPERHPGDRGGPLTSLLARLDGWLDDPAWNAAEILDVDAVRRSAAESAEVADVPVETRFVHGDLLPGNLLLTPDRQLSAIIDWGAAGYADPAQDLGLAWTVLDGPARRTFIDLVEADEAAWLRARAFELEHAVGGVLYYTPRRHPLGDVMARTLARVLDD